MQNGHMFFSVIQILNVRAILNWAKYGMEMRMISSIQHIQSSLSWEQFNLIFSIGAASFYGFFVVLCKKKLLQIEDFSLNPVEICFNLTVAAKTNRVKPKLHCAAKL